MDSNLQDDIDTFMNQKIHELQNALNITNGDVHFELQNKWDNLIGETAEKWSNMFMEVLKWQKQ